VVGAGGGAASGGSASASAVRSEVVSIVHSRRAGFGEASLLGKAQAGGAWQLRTHDLRDHTSDANRTVDDAPCGGGAGMVFRPEPVFDAVETADPPRPLFLLGPGGRRFDQQLADELAAGDGFSLLCGRYEGIDHRVHEHLVDDEVSIGDVVLAGGEAAALVMIEAVVRLLPGVLGNRSSLDEESFAQGVLEYPQYTRPALYRDWGVPDVLRSGDHGRIARWRRAQAVRATLDRRPDLLPEGVTETDARLLDEFGLAD